MVFYVPCTLVFIQKDKTVLLGMKLRGFGANLWNGFGGKIEGQESAEEAAIREVLQESGLRVNSLNHKGKIFYTFEGKEKGIIMDLYTTSDYTGVPKDSEEMGKIQWFPLDSLPLQNMWFGDRIWIPRVLKESKSVFGSIHYSTDNTQVLKSELQFK